MREEFEKLAAQGKLEGRHVETLTNLTNSGFCMHRSWGFGKITTVDTVFARFTIDFPGKPDDPPENVTLTLQSVEQRQHGVVWLRYKLTNRL